MECSLASDGLLHVLPHPELWGEEGVVVEEEAGGRADHTAQDSATAAGNGPHLWGGEERDSGGRGGREEGEKEKEGGWEGGGR